MSTNLEMIMKNVVNVIPAKVSIQSFLKGTGFRLTTCRNDNFRKQKINDIYIE
jgi:hypothetical protein